MRHGRGVGRTGGTGRRRAIVAGVVALALLTGQQVAFGATPPPPTDEDPTTPASIEVTVPYWNEPEFLLTAGAEHWNLRNRPEGTVAAGYGHETNAVHDSLTATARYEPQTPTATWSSGTPNAGRVPLDVAVLGASDGRSDSWSVSRFSDGSVDVSGPLESGLARRYVYAAPSPLRYVGGVVAASGTSTVVTILVRSDGALMRYVHQGAVVTGPDAVGSVSGAAVAAVPRSYSIANGSPRFPSLKDAVPAATSTLMIVVRSDGELVPVRVSNSAAVPQATLSSGNLQLIAGSLPANPVVDFDFSCVSADRVVPDLLPVTGVAAAVVGCGAGVARSGGTADTISLGRISVAIGQQSGFGQVVQVYTTADYATESSGQWSVVNERRSEEGCPTDGTSPVGPGSFDVRTVVGVTHLACVTLVTGQPFVRDYMQPSSAVPQESTGYTGRRDAEKAATAVTVTRTTFDRTWEPGVDPSAAGAEGTPIRKEFYGSFSRPTIALQFPCASLVGRPTRAGQALDDCDVTTLPTLGNNETAAPPPPNWKTFTIAAYAGTVNNLADRRLVVANVSASASPADRTLLSDLVASPFGPQGPGEPNYTAANFSWVFEPTIYKASDIARIKQATTIDPATVSTYTVPSVATAPPLLLAAVPRPSQTPVVLRIDDSTPVRETSPTIPLAVLQAPPVVEGLDQDTTFTPAWTQSRGEGTSTAKGVQTSVGTHVDVEASAMFGVKALGTGGGVGGGISTSFEFNKGEEKVTSNSIDVTSTTTLYGSSAHHTVVTQTIDEWVWRGHVLRDPTGIATGEPFEYRVPAANSQKMDVWDPVKLAAAAPRLYGPQGLFAASLNRLTMNAVPGDPSTYAVDGTTISPPVLLQRNGGPCIGDYTPQDKLTSVPGGAAVAVRTDNPFVSGSPVLPTGPSILVTGRQAVKWDADMGASQTLAIDTSTTSSLLTSNEFSWSLSAIFQLESEVQLGAFVKQSLEVLTGFDSSWSTSASLDQSLSNGTSVNATMADIPFSPVDVGLWLERESYDWRMFMCKGQFGPAGLGTNVWVQGYLVGDYNGTGGLTELSPAEGLAPSDGTVVPGVPAGTTSGAPLQCLATPRSGYVRFRWDSPSGTMKSYTVQLRNTTTSKTSSWEVASWSEPNEFNDTVSRGPDDPRTSVKKRPSCFEVPSNRFVDGNRYQWRVVTTGFVKNTEASPWLDLTAQVLPTSQKLTVRTPLVNGDKSVTFDVANPRGVTTLRHNIVIKRAGTTTVVDKDSDFGASYRSVPLPDGLYDATIRGYNDQVVPGTAKLALTPAVTIRFTVGPRGIRVLNAPAAYESKVPTSAVFMVRLDKPATRTVTVKYRTGDLTAKAGSDYTAVSGTVTWRIGEQIKYVRVPIRQDSRREPTEYFKVILSSPTGSQVIRWGSARGSIIDND